MPTIAVLSEDLINKIAAGEVVERPASVVKELGENALDSGARTIRVSLLEGGLREVQVEDDGCGMSREDASLSLLRHATSKLRDLDGLSAIRTQGFRGEALAAIASVSRFSLRTARRDASVGTRIELEEGAGAGPPRVADAPAVPGTRVRVCDLFFNTPARRKFMRRASTELAHSREAVVRLALSHPEVSFFLEHHGEPLFSSAAKPRDEGGTEGLKERFAAILGTELFPHLVEVEERRLGLRVHGVAARPEYTLPSARGLYTFVNGRYIRDRGLNFAIQRAYREYLPMGRQPVAALFIELDPEAVDVNVHPQKLEVRFAQASEVTDALFAALRRALRDSSASVEATGSGAGADGDLPAGARYAWAVERFLSQAREQTLGAAPPTSGVRESVLPLPLEERLGGPAPVPPKGAFASLKPLAALGRFWLCEGAGATLAVVDPHAVFERLFLSQLLAKHSIAPDGAPLLTHPVTLRADAGERFERRAAVLGFLGVTVEPFGPGAFAISAPLELDDAGAQSWAEEVSASELDRLEDAVLRERAARALACQAAKRAAGLVGWERARDPLARLELADFSLPCLHGAPVVFELPYLELERRSLARSERWD